MTSEETYVMGLRAEILDWRLAALNSSLSIAGTDISTPQKFQTAQVNAGLALIEERNQLRANVARLREAVFSVLCDPDGNPCFAGSDGDRQVIREALDATKAKSL